jgi:hypothetical protein
MAMGIRCADNATPFIRKKLTLTSATGGGRSVCIVRSRTQATDLFFVCITLTIYGAVVRVLNGIFGLKRDEVVGGWKKLHNEEPKILAAT